MKSFKRAASLIAVAAVIFTAFSSCGNRNGGDFTETKTTEEAVTNAPEPTPEPVGRRVEALDRGVATSSFATAS